MADSKIIFIDVDGTLVDYENKLPASADKAIKQARKNGHLDEVKLRYTLIYGILVLMA